MSKWEFLEGTAPSTPSSGRVSLYAKTDGLLYSKDDAGAETALGGGSSTFTVAGDSGTPQTISSGNTLTIAGGTGLDTVASATDTLTINIDSTVATLTGSQTLTNKTINADNNTVTNIGSSEITADIITGLTADASPDGSADYIMTYDNSATALKKVLLNNLPSGSSLPVVDTTGIAKGSSDATKIVRLEVDGLTTGTTRVMTVPDADLTIVGTATTQTLTNKTIDASSNTITNIGSSEVTADLITGMTADTNPDNAADYVMTYDNSATALKKVLTGKLGAKYAIIRDQRASGTASGSSSTTTWNSRTLQTEHYDPDGIVSISSNQFTPIAGEYILVGWATAVNPASTQLLCKMRVYNVTGAAAVAYGLNTYVGVIALTQVIMHMSVKFTANGTDAYRFETYSSTGQATNGLGVAHSLASIDEIFLEATLLKIG